MGKSDREFDVSDVLGGTLNIFGLKLDLAKLLSSSEDVNDRLEELREKLTKAGGRDLLGADAWRRGEASISGHFRTSGIIGEREYHIGTAGSSTRPEGQERASEPLEPPVDVFHEGEEVMIVADVPGVELADLKLRVEDDVVSISTKPSARRSYRKEIKLGSPVDRDSLKASCRNGVLEVRLQNRPA